jgi:hypothetical protein
MANQLNDSTANSTKATPNDGASEASAHLLAEVHRLHVASFNRNNKDNADSVNLGLNSDKKGIALANTTMAQADTLQQYLAKGGDFSDAEGKKLGAQFIAQLRRESDDHRQDRAGAAEFVGKAAMPEATRQQALKDNKSISDAAKTLLDPKATEQDRAAALTKIGSSADSIAKGLHDSTGKAGKDQTSAAAESAVIAADVKALQGANLTPEQKAQLAKDIASKSGLIKNELNDSPNEQTEIQHDSAAIHSGAKLEAQLRYAMEHPGHSSKTLSDLKKGLGALNNGEGTGILEAVKIDRQADSVMEPIYMAANTADNTQNNSQIIEFTNPYKNSTARR